MQAQEGLHGEPMQMSRAPFDPTLERESSAASSADQPVAKRPRLLRCISKCFPCLGAQPVEHADTA
jgi:hypothetical protein